jgi:hypothetical protein
MASYVQGGWYDNPATGKNQQWWNGAFLPVGTTNNSPGVSGGNGSGGSGATLYGGTPVSAIQGPAVQPFGWSAAQWNQAQQDALTKLTPYYQQLLALNNGDVNRAKTALEADYATGVRFNTADFQNQMSQENLTEADEQKSMLDDLNSRGILFQETAPGQQPNTPTASGTVAPTPTVGVVSDFSGMQPTATQQTMDTSGIVKQPNYITNPGASGGESYSSAATNQYFDPLLDKQQQRRNAIQRAIQKTTETATNDFVQNIGDQNSQQTEKALDLGNQEDQQAMQMAQDEYQHQADVAQGSQTGVVQPYLDTNSSTNVTGG